MLLWGTTILLITIRISVLTTKLSSSVTGRAEFSNTSYHISYVVIIPVWLTLKQSKFLSQIPCVWLGVEVLAVLSIPISVVVWLASPSMAFPQVQINILQLLSTLFVVMDIWWPAEREREKEKRKRKRCMFTAPIIGEGEIADSYVASKNFTCFCWFISYKGWVRSCIETWFISATLCVVFRVKYIIRKGPKIDA